MSANEWEYVTVPMRIRIKCAEKDRAKAISIAKRNTELSEIQPTFRIESRAAETKRFNQMDPWNDPEEVMCKTKI